jgi:hypothetical protein
MKISRGIALASLMTLAASPVFAGFSLDDVTKAASSMQGGNAATAAAPTSETAGLLQAVTGLGVTPQQAVGGTSAMLGAGEEPIEQHRLFAVGQRSAGHR